MAKQSAFFCHFCAQLMRRILLNHARDNNVNKRGGGASEINLDDAVIISPEKSKELIALDEVLEQSAKFY